MTKKQVIIFDDSQNTFVQSLILAAKDIANGIFSSVLLWNMLAWQDIKQRYRRSFLGPFWLTISIGVMVLALGFLYAELFKKPVAEYLPFVGIGIIIWNLLASIANESSTVFCDAAIMIKQVRQPLTMYICRMVWRNVLIFLHNSLIIIGICFFIPEINYLHLLSIPLALITLAANGIWIGLVLGIIGTRFRDTAPMINSLVQVAFFLTPIVWKPEILSQRAWFVDLNPAYHYIHIVRAPILNEGIPIESWLAVATLTIAGSLLAIIILTKYRHRVAYWAG